MKVGGPREESVPSRCAGMSSGTNVRDEKTETRGFKREEQMTSTCETRLRALTTLVSICVQ
jgi:hypothetical protein